MIHRISKLAAVGGVSVAFYTLVASTALALFLPQAKLQKMSFKTANMLVLVSKQQIDSPAENSFLPLVDFSGTAQLVPGGPEIHEDFWVKNASSENQILRLSGQLSTGAYDWEMLKDVIQLRLRVYGTTDSLPWLSLREWSEQSHDFPGDRIWDDGRKRYEFSFRLIENYPVDPDGAGPLQAGSPVGHELMNKETGALVFTIDGRKE